MKTRELLSLSLALTMELCIRDDDSSAVAGGDGLGFSEIKKLTRVVQTPKIAYI